MVCMWVVWWKNECWGIWLGMLVKDMERLFEV